MQNNPGNPTSLAELNDFILLPCGVYTSNEHSAGVSYSDGDSEEEYIYQVISSAQDISSLSEELRGFERDWSSECHLSSKRSNVFRALNFDGIETILEVGSGCGAITRFLGELGSRVDAIEGSLRRAEITRLRCRDLANVSVIHTDFNSLQLPTDHYDLALLTGVLEYAGKYGEAGQSAVDAAVVMLRRILASLGPQGKLIVAIENRIGFKYLAGASEDHFSRPWVGICKYPECDEPLYKKKEGIETWDRAQWKGMISRLPVLSCEWYYPFPDYKLSSTLLSEKFIHESPFASACLTRIQSRDYTATWRPQINEQLFWQTAGAAGILEEMANSFVLVLQKNRQADSDFVPFDFVHFSGQTRKPAYRIMVQKKKKEQRVEKNRMFGQLNLPESDIITQHLAPEPFHEGELLITLWLRSLKSCSAPATLDALLKEYYSYLLKECKASSPGSRIDLLPMNIVVAPDDSWRHFDQEWHAAGDISPQFILFRTVLYLYWDNKEILSALCRNNNLSSGWQFVEYCLGRILYSNEINIKAFVELENTFQRSISRRDAFAPVEHLLDSSPGDASPTWSWKRASLLWGKHADVAQPVTAKETDSGVNIVFSLPVAVCSSPFIQLHLGVPERQVGAVFIIRRFKFFGMSHDGSRKCLFPLQASEDLPAVMELSGLSFYESIRGGVYTVDAKDSQILHFVFPKNIDCTNCASVECEVKIEFLPLTGSDVQLERLLAEKQKTDIALDESSRLVDEKMKEIINRDEVIAEKIEEVLHRDNIIAEKIDEIKILYHQVEAKKHRLNEIEESRAWQLILKLRRAKKRFYQLIGKKHVNSQETIEHAERLVDNSATHVGSDEQDSLCEEVESSHESTLATTLEGVEQDRCLKSDGANRLFEKGDLDKKPNITVIIAVYNTLPVYLQKTLDSVLMQSYAAWEIILVDSGSTNGATLKMLSEINHPRIKVHLSGPLKNLTHAMAEGAGLASGKCLIFLGHYDRLRSEALAIIVQQCLRQELDGLYWDEAVINLEGEEIETVHKIDPLHIDQLPDEDPVGSTFCVSKSFYDKGAGVDPLYDGAHFFEFVLRARGLNGKFCYLQKTLSETKRFESVSRAEQERLQKMRLHAWRKSTTTQGKTLK